MGLAKRKIGRAALSKTEPWDIYAQLLSRDAAVGRKRRYKQPETALPRAIAWLLRDGHAGSTVEIYSNSAGVQFATVRMTALGKIKVEFNLEGLK